ncbi:MAG: OPT/YSL family transporter [Candidatus Micrarchaeota archaeon]|nr:OPT/YSL family transporter [Candidatus Micrarchaeota archaeon]
MRKDGFPWRALLVGAFLSVLVALYSSYAGLKVGGVYWPMVTTAVACLAICRALGWGGSSETNVMQTTASTGGLLAAGVIFTIPALYMLGLPVSQTDVVLVCLAGGLLGVLFVYPLREEMIVREKLAYADGTAAAAIIKAGDSGGKQAVALAGAFGVGAFFAAAREASARLYSFAFQHSLIPYAGGFLIGLRFTLAWFAGALASVFLLFPYAVSSGLAQSEQAARGAIAAPLGAGIVMGAALAYLAFLVAPMAKRAAEYYGKAGSGRLSALGILFAALLLIYAFDLSLPAAILAMLGAFLMAAAGARITGEMNVDPMEIFAMILLLAAKFLFGFGVLHLVLLTAVVCIAAGIAGDAMQDFKTGYLLKTPPQHQLAGEVVGVLSASLAMGILISSFAQAGFGGEEFPAPQAVAVREVARADSASHYLLGGALAGLLFTLLCWKLGVGAIAVAFGIGLYVPMSLSFPLFVGGVLRYLADRAKKTEFWRLVAGGVIAGEGLVGALLVIWAAKSFLGF